MAQNSEWSSLSDSTSSHSSWISTNTSPSAPSTTSRNGSPETLPITPEGTGPLQFSSPTRARHHKFKCEICSECTWSSSLPGEASHLSFSDISEHNRNAHMLTRGHCDPAESPHISCPIPPCDKRYTRRSDLTRHIHKKHPGENFTPSIRQETILPRCGACGKAGFDGRCQCGYQVSGSYNLVLE